MYLTEGEIAGLLQTVRERADADFAYFLHAIPAFTGMRRGEVLRLRWSDIDLIGGSVTACSRKQSRQKQEVTRAIDLHPWLRRDLLAWKSQRPRGQFVFCGSGDLTPLGGDRANRHFWQPMRGTSSCLSGKKNWFKVGFHTYRHSFASGLATRGVDQRLIDHAMGHHTDEMRKRYQHFSQKIAARQSVASSPTSSRGHEVLMEGHPWGTSTSGTGPGSATEVGSRSAERPIVAPGSILGDGGRP